MLNSDVNTNANAYFDKAKKLKKKIGGIDMIVGKTKKEISELEEKREEFLEKEEKREKLVGLVKKEWYEKNFRFTFTSSGFLFVCGNDAQSNEVLLKKYLGAQDIVFHTEEAGSPFGLLKDAKNKASEEDLFEVAQFLACFSRQWKKGFGVADVFYVDPSQVSKQAQSGEYLAKGSFMVRGKKTFLKNIPLKICLGVETLKVKDEESEEELESLRVISGSEAMCTKRCGKRMVKLLPGGLQYKDLSKELKARLKFGVQDLPKFLPEGCRFEK